MGRQELHQMSIVLICNYFYDDSGKKIFNQVSLCYDNLKTKNDEALLVLRAVWKIISFF